MSRRRQRDVWFMGPERHGAKWRIRVVHSDGQRTSFACETEEQARQLRLSLERERLRPGEIEIETAIEKYKEYLLAEKGNKAGSVTTTLYRLRSFFPDPKMPLSSLSERVCKAHYEELRSRSAVDTHRNTLNQTRTFLNWCVQRKHIRRNPLIAIKGEGQRNHGKPQLRIDEARRWTSAALALAEKGEAGATAALLTLFLGVRASEIVQRQVRDLDDNGRLLWIPVSKTKAGKRTVEVPEFLQKHLLAQTRSKLPQAKLFVGDRHWVRRWVVRICRLAEVPEVNAHSMRGLHATLAVQSGVTPHVVATSIGHESESITLSSYARPGSLEQARQKKVVSIIGRKEEV